MSILSIDRIRLGGQAANKEDAIRQVGQLLVDTGCVSPAYVEGMLVREASMSTYLGNGVAIPHGMHENIADIKTAGIAVLQIPSGVEWEEDEIAHLVIGIASGSDDHVEILANLADVLEEEEDVMKLAKTEDPQSIVTALSGQPEAEG